VKLVVSARKVRADGAGNEQDMPMDTRVDIGVLDGMGNVLSIERLAVHSGENRFTLDVPGEPARAGIDPLNKFIDRDDQDNTVVVTRP
jgi:ABC-2 type transport system permease protein